MNPTKEEMYQWYVVERKSYRQIMQIMGMNNARKVKKLLTEYGIEIRKGSEAVKTQWESNEKRRKQQGRIFAECHKGTVSPKRLDEKQLQMKLSEVNLTLISREIINGYTHYTASCDECGEVKTSILKNICGCKSCATRKNAEQQRTPFEEVKALFDSYGVVLIDTEFERSSKPMAYICPEHSHLGVQYTSYEKAKIRGCCKHCRILKRREKYGFNDTMSEREKMAFELKEWRISVFERDNYVCQCCFDSKGGNLNAHHILNFATHKHLRLDIDNGITLCEKCHNPSVEGSFHHIYGTYNNTREQLVEYIASKQAAR